MFYLAALNIAAKAALIGLLVYGALRPELPQFEGNVVGALIVSAVAVSRSRAAASRPSA
jgi:hypothetical protein